MFQAVYVFLAFAGAIGIICALAFVTLLIGVLVNAMVTLASGPLIDAVLRKRGLTQWL
jgi:hypothetical protein